LDGLEGETSELRKKFDSFVGESFYGQMLHEMRKTVGKSAYFNGGHAEEVFRGQLDQVIATKLAESNAKDFTGSMFRLFSLTRS
jgi:flagellar protein FlgJ